MGTKLFSFVKRTGSNLTPSARFNWFSFIKSFLMVSSLALERIICSLHYQRPSNHSETFIQNNSVRLGLLKSKDEKQIAS